MTLTHQPRPVLILERDITAALAEPLAAAGRPFLYATRVSGRHDRIQSFIVGPGNAELAGGILADAGYHVHHASRYIVHVIA